MIKNTIYVAVRHWGFWYGVYGLCNKSWSDEITLYLDKEKNSVLGHFDLLTERCLIHLMHNVLDRAEDNDFRDEIEAFIKGNKDVAYSYIYPRDEEDVLYQVGHLAPVNDKGFRPTYIYVFSRLSEAWDAVSVKEIVNILANDFLAMEIGDVELIEIPTYEEAKISYEEDGGRFNV